MECHFCKGLMKEGKTSYTISRKDYHLVIDNLPSLVCQQCGEPYFGEDEVDLIQSLIRDVDKKSEQLHKVAV